MRKTIALLLLITFSSSSFALPSLTNKCGEKRINLKLPVESDIIAYNKECDTAYIGPPSTGTAKVTSIIPTSNLNFCPTVKTLPNVVNSISDSMQLWMDKLAKKASETLELEQYMNKQRELLIEYEEEEKELETKIAALKEERHEKIIEIKSSTDRLSECEVLSADKQKCDVIATEVINLKKSLVKFRKEQLSPTENDYYNATRKSRELKRKIEQASENIAANTEIFEKYKKRLVSLRNEAIEQYGIFGALEGATAQILFESNWRSQIEIAKRQNRFRDLHIEALPIIRSKIHLDSSIIKSAHPNMPSALIYANIPGFEKSGTTKESLPSGNSHISDLNSDIAAHNSFLSGVSGKVVFSLIGICNLTDSDNVLKPKTSFNDLSGYITLNAVYEYPMLNERKHTVSFRASRFAEEIEKKTESGGFFHTSSVNEITHETYSKDDFHIDFESENAQDSYSLEEQKLLTIEAKKEIVDRVLKEIGTISQLKEKRPPVPAYVKQSGAVMIYKETPCLGWTFCSVGTFVVGVLDSIFGNKEAMSKFKSTNNMIVKHTYSSQKPATYAFTTTYKAAE